MPIDTKALTQGIVKPVELPSWVQPVGIASPVNVNGNVSTKTAGSGTGIFNKVLDIAGTVYSTWKGATTTTQTNVANQVSQTDNTFVGGDGAGTGSGTNGSMKIPGWLQILGLVVLLKMLRIL